MIICWWFICESPLVLGDYRTINDDGLASPIIPVRCATVVNGWGSMAAAPVGGSQLETTE